MANTNFFYSNGKDIGIVTESSETSDYYSPVGNVGTLKLFGRFSAKDLDADTDIPELINPRYHIAIAYKVLSELDKENGAVWYKKYMDKIVSIRKNQNPLNAKRRIRQYHF